VRHLYVITCRDLPSGPQAVQSTHAALNFSMEHPEVTQKWFKVSNYLELRSVDDEQALLNLAQKADQHGLRFSIFREPDLNDRATAIAIEPSDKTRKICKDLPRTLQ
jgi:hypothetical protein